MLEKCRLTFLILSLVVLLGVETSCSMVSAGTTAPNVSTILDVADKSRERVIFEEDFEENDSVHIREINAGEVPHKIVFSGVTSEQAFSGKHSYKLKIEFEPGRYAQPFYVLPAEIPVWSELKVTMYVKAISDPSVDAFPYRGLMLSDVEMEYSGTPLIGKKTGEKDGWEIWEASVRNHGGAGQFIDGPWLGFQLPDHCPATTVTIYVDKITITGKLPPDYAEKWRSIRDYYKAETEQKNRKLGARRLSDIKKCCAEINAGLARLKPLNGGSPMLREQYDEILKKVRADVKSVEPMIESIGKALTDKGSRFGADLNNPERIIMLASHYLDIASAYPAYAARYSEPEFITFALDLTQSYPILPCGPMAHNEELSYYLWGANCAGGLENPQILPNDEMVAAKPSRILNGFGCRGTCVPLSFAIHAGRDLKDVVFTISDLKSKKGVIRNSAVDIRVVAPWYRPFNNKPRLMNELLLHDPEFVVPLQDKERNRFKDPKYGDDAPRLLPVTIPAGTSRQFYILTRVPDGVPAGIYKGSITANPKDGKAITWSIALEVLPFDLEPTPYAYSAYYRSVLKDEAFKKAQGVHSWHKTRAQMEAELKNMAEHGFNTLNLPDAGELKKTEQGWDFSALGVYLAAAKRVGLTRSPFIWWAQPFPLLPDPRPNYPKTMEEVIQGIDEMVPAVNEFCRKNGYPRPSFYGWDEASGETLMALAKSYRAVNEAGGLLAVACYPNYFGEIGAALSLPIVQGGAQTPEGMRSMHASQKAGYEVWTYNTPCTDMAASPSVYRRRYGLAVWRNGEQGAIPWNYSAVPYREIDSTYEFNYEQPIYEFAFPTWSGKPIDTVIYEAFREGIYDTRYMATLRKYLDEVRASRSNPRLVKEVDRWMAGFSIHEDLQKVRRHMADYIIKLRKTRSSGSLGFRSAADMSLQMRE